MTANRKAIEAVARELSSDALQLVNRLEDAEGEEVHRLHDWSRQQQMTSNREAN